MARKSDSDFWLKLALVFAGTGVLSEALTPRKPCPQCGFQVKAWTKVCPNCEAQLRWSRTPVRTGAGA